VERPRDLLVVLADISSHKLTQALSSIPLARPVAAALILAFLAALAMSRAAHLDVHHLLRGVLDQFAHRVSIVTLGDYTPKVIMVSVIVLSFVVVGFNNLRLRRSAVPTRTAARFATPKGSARSLSAPGRALPA
jgi:hypothetical protein